MPSASALRRDYAKSGPQREIRESYTTQFNCYCYSTSENAARMLAMRTPSRHATPCVPIWHQAKFTPSVGEGTLVAQESRTYPFRPAGVPTTRGAESRPSAMPSPVFGPTFAGPISGSYSVRPRGARRAALPCPPFTHQPNRAS